MMTNDKLLILLTTVYFMLLLTFFLICAFERKHRKRSLTLKSIICAGYLHL